MANEYEIQALALMASWGIEPDHREQTEIFRQRIEFVEQRDVLTMKYAWGIPTEEAITEIAKLSPILEVFAGNGYWAHLLTEAGADIIATDLEPWSKPWCNVKQMDAAEAVIAYPNRTLMMVFPVWGNAALNALNAYTGEYLVYVSELDGTLTPNKDFAHKLRTEFKSVKTITIPRWLQHNDEVHILQRV